MTYVVNFMHTRDLQHRDEVDREEYHCISFTFYSGLNTKISGFCSSICMCTTEILKYVLSSEILGVGGG